MAFDYQIQVLSLCNFVSYMSGDALSTCNRCKIEIAPTENSPNYLLL